jgi:hypothetical protein
MALILRSAQRVSKDGGLYFEDLRLDPTGVRNLMIKQQISRRG